MAGRRRRGGSPVAPPQALEDDDLLADILIRLPPEPSSVARASAVCKGWRRLLSDPSFFVVWDPATRHLFVVWDPATGDRRCVPVAPGFDDKERIVFNGAVLCASGDDPGHVHGVCHWSPFRVVLIGANAGQTRAFACVYSSETGAWGDIVSTAIRYMDTISSPSTLIGNSLYWLVDDIDVGILEFDLDTYSLAVIEPLDMVDRSGYNCQIILAEDRGGLGLAVTTDFSLDKWDRKVSGDGVGKWVLRKTVNLEEITGLPGSKRGHMIIHGYDEDSDVIFLRTDIGCFVVKLESMEFRNLGKRDFITTCAYHTYRSFYSCKGFTIVYRMVWDDCIRAFEEQKLILHKVLNSADCRISLTTDTLTLNETTGYMCVTCHFINTDWKLQKRIIKFFVVEKPHNGVEIFDAVLKCIQDWKIEEKIFGITVGKSAANVTMVDMLKRDLVHKKVIPMEGKLLHNHCAVQIINLIVNDVLDFLDPILGKVT